MDWCLNLLIRGGSLRRRCWSCIRLCPKKIEGWTPCSVGCVLQDRAWLLSQVIECQCLDIVQKWLQDNSLCQHLFHIKLFTAGLYISVWWSPQYSPQYNRSVGVRRDLWTSFLRGYMGLMVQAQPHFFFVQTHYWPDFEYHNTTVNSSLTLGWADRSHKLWLISWHSLM